MKKLFPILIGLGLTGFSAMSRRKPDAGLSAGARQQP